MPLSEQFLQDVAHYFNPSRDSSKYPDREKIKLRASYKENLAGFKKYFPEHKITKEHEAEIQNAHKNIGVKQVFENVPRPKQFLPIFSKHDNSFQIDITHMDRANILHNEEEYKKLVGSAPTEDKTSEDFHNSGTFHYMLTAIDVNSRYAYAYPLKTKSGADVIPAMKHFFDDVKSKTGSLPYSITSDLGSEFINGDFTRLCSQNNVEIYKSNPNDHNKMGKIERFHRTLKQLLLMEMSQDEKPWSELLPDVMKYYNHEKKNSALGKPPAKYNYVDKDIQYAKYKAIYHKVLDGKTKEEVESFKNNDEDPVKIRIPLPNPTENLKADSVFRLKYSTDPVKIHKMYPSGTMSVIDPETGNVKVDKNNQPIRYKPYQIKNVSGRYNFKSNFADRVQFARKEKLIANRLKKAGITAENVIKNVREKRVRRAPGFLKDYYTNGGEVKGTVIKKRKANPQEPKNKKAKTNGDK